MQKKLYNPRHSIFTCLLVLMLVTSTLGVFASPAAAQEGSIDTSNGVVEGQINVISPYYSEQHITGRNGASLTASIINGPSQPPYSSAIQKIDMMTASSVSLSNVPAYSWVFGCSAVSGSMIAGYYDRTGYPNIYTGPTNSGVTPLVDTGWSTWSDGSKSYPNNPLIASHNGIDGRATRGSIDDYWVQYQSTASDPYITGSWTQHSWGSAIGDYMKTSQSAYSNSDGSTQFYNYTSSATKLTCSDMVSGGISDKDGTYGRKLFYEARGYTVTDCFNQHTDNVVTGGFSFADYKTQIDAGHPVMINVVGHTMVGMGYDDSSQTVYLHDTWGNYTTSMPWGGAYQGMQMNSVSIVNLAPIQTVPTLIAPSGTISTTSPTFQWSTISGASQYEYQVLSGSTVVIDQTIASSSCGASSCSDTPTGTLSNGSYTWKARAYTTAWQDYSATTTFTVSVTSSLIPSLVAPTGTIDTNTPTFEWTPVSGATQYNFQVFSGESKVVEVTVGSVLYHCTSTLCSFDITDALSDGSYTWKARAYTTAWQDFSPAGSFTVLTSENPVPTLVAPTGTIDTPTPTYQWTPVTGASQYELVVLSGTNTVVDNVVTATSTCTSTLCSTLPDTSLDNGSYTWEVRAYIGSWQNYSSEGSFTVSAVTIPTPTSPSGTVYTKTPTFNWSPISEGSMYEIQVLSGSSVVLDDYAYSTDCTTSTCTYIPSAGLSNGTYTWKVRGYADDWFDYSSTLSFTVKVSLIPTLSPMGTIINTKPRFYWTPVSGATKYEISIMNKNMNYGNPAISTSICSSTLCTFQLPVPLAYGPSTWVVRGYANGAWQEFSSTSSLNLVTTTAGQPFNFYFNDDAPNWTNISGSWSVVNGNLATPAFYTEAYNASSAHAGSYSTFDYKATVKTTGNGWSILIFRGDSSTQESNWYDWENAYYFVATPQNQNFMIYKRVDGTMTKLLDWTTSSYILSTSWNTMEVKAKGVNQEFYINGHLVATGSDDSFASGQVGLGGYSGSADYMFYATSASLSTSVTLSSADEIAMVPTFHPQPMTSAEIKALRP